MANQKTSDTERQSSIEEDNINHICLCGQKVTKYPYLNNDECRTCCKEIEKTENTYYMCYAKQCIHKEMTGYYFTTCNACHETVNNSNRDAKHSFLFYKVASLIEQIRKETKQCNNNDQRRRYMYWVYLLLYTQCIAKLKAAFVKESEYEEINDMFDAFYGG
eukprot:489397_1